MHFMRSPLNGDEPFQSQSRETLLFQQHEHNAPAFAFFAPLSGQKRISLSDCYRGISPHAISNCLPSSQYQFTADSSAQYKIIQKDKTMPTGKIKWFDPEGGNDLFVHHSETEGYALDDGDAVEFEVGQGKKGPCPTKVRKV